MVGKSRGIVLRDGGREKSSKRDLPPKQSSTTGGKAVSVKHSTGKLVSSPTKQSKHAVSDQKRAFDKPWTKLQRQRANRRKRQAGIHGDDPLSADGKRAQGDDNPGSQGKLKGVGAVGADFRRAHGIVVEGPCPPPVETFGFAKKALGEGLVRHLRKQGYTAPTPIQAQAWPIVLEGHDLVGISATGSGKTCAFLLPILARLAERRSPAQAAATCRESARPQALVLAPTRELIQQVAGVAVKFSIGPSESRPRCVVVFGGADKKHQMEKLAGPVDILLATPGRLLDIIGTRPPLTLDAVTYLVIDEADQMLDMGFGPDIRKIVGMCPETGTPCRGGGASGPKAASTRQTLFFTATWPEAVKNSALEFTALESVHVRIGQASDPTKLTANSMVTQSVLVTKENKKRQRVSELLSKELQASETAIVFCATQGTCDSLYRMLKGSLDGWCSTLHGGMNQQKRNAALREFRSLTNQRGVLIATDVAARGLDIPDVAIVVIYDFYGHGGRGGGPESYVHRIGRTGRAGKTGRAITLFGHEDFGAGDLAELLQRAGQSVPDSLQALVESSPKAEWKQGGPDKPKRPAISQRSVGSKKRANSQKWEKPSRAAAAHWERPLSRSMAPPTPLPWDC